MDVRQDSVLGDRGVRVREPAAERFLVDPTGLVGVGHAVQQRGDGGHVAERGRAEPRLRRPRELDFTFRIAQPVPLTTVRVVRTHLGALRAHGSACRDHRENRERLPLTAARVL